MLRPIYPIWPLPLQAERETVPVLRALVEANKALAELKGRAATIPNQGILIDTLALQEAKASSEIENIVITQDELFQADLFPEGPDSVAAKEVALYRYRTAIGLILREFYSPVNPGQFRIAATQAGQLKLCVITIRLDVL